MHLLLLAFACAPEPEPSSPTDTGGEEPVDTGEPDDTGTPDDTADSGDTGTAVDADADGHAADVDCDDANPAIHPAAAESCNDVDDNCDGEVDEGAPSIAMIETLTLSGQPTTGAQWFGYDADDHLVLMGGDYDEDGVLDYYTRHGWTDGYMTSEWRSNDGITVASSYEYDRDAQGRITEARIDSDGDGDWDWAWGYGYDGDLYTGYWYDEGADGDYEQAWGYEYDADGNLTYGWSDYDGDGHFESESWHVYVDGKQVSYSADNDGDGIVETNATFTWEGERLMEELGAVGSNPYRKTYLYTDADDRYEFIEYDAGDDGSLEWLYGATWDGELATSYSYDEFGDGVAVVSYTYAYDAEGRTIAAASLLDGTYTSFTEYEWQGTGWNYLAYRYDVNADGAWDVIQQYSPGGNTIYVWVDNAGDGVVDSITVNTYDTRERWLGSTVDTLGDGVLETEMASADGYHCGSL